MAVKFFVLPMKTAPMHGMDTKYWHSSGLCCRTPISL